MSIFNIATALPKFLLLTGLLGASLHASSIAITIQTNLSSPSGATLNLFGTIQNLTGAGLWINNGAGVSIASPLSASEDYFNLNAADFLLPASGTSASLHLLDITIPAGSAPGNYNGAWTILGGDLEIESQDNLGSLSFTVNIPSTGGNPPAPAPVPEPASAVAIASALFFMATKVRRRALWPCIALACSLSAAGPSKPSAAKPAFSTAKAQELAGKQPLAFVPNLGQGEARIRYTARSASGTLFLTGDAVYLSTLHTKHGVDGETPKYDATRFQYDVETIELRMKGANKHPRMTNSNALPFTVDYFQGRDESQWVTKVPQYETVLARDVYRGIDVAYYGSARELEYDFIVQPGADPRQIQLAFAGHQGLELASSGDLILHTRHGDVVQKRPAVYQLAANGQRVAIAADYLLDQGSVGVKLAAYDHARPLIIDPIIRSSVYIGSANSTFDAITAISQKPMAYYDASGGYALVAGHTMATSTIPSVASTFPSHGNLDAYLAVMDLTSSQPAYTYAAYIGGTENEFAFAAAAIQADRTVTSGPARSIACIAGTTYSTNFPLLNQRPDQQVGPPTVVETILVVDPSNPFQTQYIPQDVTLDNIYVYDGYVTCVDPYTNSLTMSTLIGGRGGTQLTALATANDDTRLTFGGFGPGPLIFADQCYTRLTNSRYSSYCPLKASDARGRADIDGVIGQLSYYSAAASAIYQFGGTGNEYINGVAGSSQGIVGVGTTASTDLTTGANTPVSIKTFQSGLASATDALIVQLHQLPNTSFAIPDLISWYGGPGGITVASSVTTIANSGSTSFYRVGGSTRAADLPFHGYSPFNGGLDAFIGAVSTNFNGTATMSTSFYGGSNDDTLTGITFGNGGGSTYFTGTTKSTNLPISEAIPGQSALKGVSDAFVAQLGNGGFSSYLGGGGSDTAYGITVFGDNLLYVAGLTTSTDFPRGPVPGAITSPYLLSTPTPGVNSTHGFLTLLRPTSRSSVTVNMQSNQSVNYLFTATPAMRFTANTTGLPCYPVGSGFAVNGGTYPYGLFQCDIQDSSGVNGGTSLSVTAPLTYHQNNNDIQQVFTGWGDGVQTATRLIVPDLSTLGVTVLAKFDTQFKLNLATNGAGTASPVSPVYALPDALVSITATPNQGATFTGWSADPDITDPSSASTTVKLSSPGKTVTANFTAATVSNKQNPTINWANPADILFGGALSASQLNASSVTPGSFAYNPPSGTVLTTGDNQSLNVTFTPADTVAYNVATKTVKINVKPSPPGGIVVTRAFTKDVISGDWVEAISLANTSASTYTNVMVNSGTLATVASSSSLPVTIGAIPAGAVATTTIRFPGSAAAAGASVTSTLGGVYNGGSFSSSIRVKLP